MLPTPSIRRDFALLLLAVPLLLAWDASGLDLVLVRWYGDRAGFVWREAWVTQVLLHDGARHASQAVLGTLAVSLRWAPRWLRAVPTATRTWWLVTTLACALAIVALKRGSLTSCPWSLAEFGGVARYVSHWQWGMVDGGEGHCFPSGHASSAFALIGGVYALRATHPRAARWWGLGVVLVGLALGWVQMMRGAHYLSHTLWTAWVCWALTLAAAGSARLVQPLRQALVRS